MSEFTRAFDVRDTDWTIAGNGDARDGATSITLEGVSGTVSAAYLLWGELDFGDLDTVVMFDGTEVSGTSLGEAVDTCWESDGSHAFRADVTSLVTGNGTFSVSGMDGGQGASLLVFFDDGNDANNRDVTLFNGNLVNDDIGDSLTLALDGIGYASGTANLTLGVGDGQSFEDGPVNLDGTSLGTDLFDGSNGALWDIEAFDITSFMMPGLNDLEVTYDHVNDCLQFIHAVVDVVHVPNIQPDAVDDEATTDEDTPITVDVLDNDTDPEDDPLTIQSASTSDDAVVEIIANEIRVTPDPDVNGEIVVSYVINDGFGNTDTATLTVDVLPVPDMPVIEPQTVLLPGGQTEVGIVMASDPDGDDLMFNIAGGVDSGDFELDDLTGLLTFKSAPDFGDPQDEDGDGTHEIVIRVLDGTFTDTATVSVTIIEPLVTEAIDDTVMVDEDTTVDIDVLGNDTAAPGKTLSIIGSTITGNGTLVLNAAGPVTYSPDTEFSGTDTFTYTISDGMVTDTAVVSITVNPLQDPPVAMDDAAATDEDMAVDIDVLGNDTDADGDLLTVEAVTQGANGTVSIDGDGSVIYTPDADFNGTDSFTYTITDGTATDTASVTVTIAPVNDPPMGGADSAMTDEDTPVTFDVLGNDNDPEGDMLSVVSVDDSGANGTVVITPDDDLTYTPDPDFNGTDTFTYVVSDGSLTDMVTVTVMVAPVNDPPAAMDDMASTDEDMAVDIDVLANDTDVDGDTVSVALVMQGANGTVSIEGDGSVIYTPDADFNGTDSFSYTVTDGSLAGTATVTVVVSPVNDAPVATEDMASTDEDVAVDIDVLGNDTDVDGDTVSVASVMQGANGTVSIDGDGSVIYTPDADFTGTDTFTYTITDGSLTDTATVTVMVNPVNDAPVAVEDMTSTDEDTAVDIEILDNDSDPEDDPISVIATTIPANGTVSIDGDGSVIYTPDPDFNGTDSFTYTITDGSLTDTATVMVMVNPVNDAPVATDDMASTDENRAVDIEVLPNDTDVDGDSLSVDAVTQGTNGTVSIDGDGSVIYTPDPGFFGTDTFGYTVTDGSLTDTATVTVMVAMSDGQPIAVDDGAMTTDGLAVEIDVLDNDSHEDGAPISIASATIAANGTVLVTEDGPLTYTPFDGFTGTDTFSYTITDGSFTDSAVVTVMVGPAPEPVDETFNYNDGDGPMDFMGGGGEDTLRIFGSDEVNDTVSLTNDDADTQWELLFNGVESTGSGIEEIEIRTYAGTDTVFVGDNLDLAGVSPDTVKVWLGADDDDFFGADSTVSLEVRGGAGNDSIVGGTLGDELRGGADDDELRGNGGADLVFGGQGNDLIFHVSGDGADSIDGGGGQDMLSYLGLAGADDVISVLSEDGTPDRLEFIENGTVLDVTRVEDLEIHTRSGNDTVLIGAGLEAAGVSQNTIVALLGSGDDVFDGTSSTVALDVRGGAGNDVILGGQQDDELRGGGDNDLLDGGLGDDNIFAGAGDDTIVHARGDGEDRVRGGAGTDVFAYTSTGLVDEMIEILNVAGSPDWLEFTADGVTVDIRAVEVIEVNSGGGSDTLLVGADLELAGVSVNTVQGNLGVGNDILDGTASTVSLNIHGGNDDDLLEGSALADELNGGNQNDTLIGHLGDDRLIGGNGNDLFVHVAGDGSDRISGGAGLDTLTYTGLLAAADTISIMNVLGSPSRLEFMANGETLDVDTVETIDLTLGDGDDEVIIGADLQFAGVAQNTITGDLGRNADTLDGALSTVALDFSGGNGKDTLTGGSRGDTLRGDGGNDTINGYGGADVLEGGLGEDEVFGGTGNDTILYTNGDGADLVDGGHGNDLFRFVSEGLVDDVIDLANVADSDATLEFTANGVTVEIGDVEQLDILTGAGADMVTVGPDLEFAGVSVNTVSGNLGGEDDMLLGGDATVSLDFDGGAGDDKLIGSSLADVLRGGSGNDTIMGGGGGDDLFGGSGADTFVFMPGDLAGSFIRDFDASEDRIEIHTDAAPMDWDVNGDGRINIVDVFADAYNGNGRVLLYSWGKFTLLFEGGDRLEIRAPIHDGIDTDAIDFIPI